MEPIGIIAILGPLAVALLVLWVLRTAPPLEHVHTLDCKDWSTRGVIDPLCRAPHSTDHFATIREQVNLQTSFDQQIGFKP